MFLDVSQAVDKLRKLQKNLSEPMFIVLKSYLRERHFYVRHENKTTKPFAILSGVSQRSVLHPILRLLHTEDLLINNNIITATYTDNTAILTVHENPVKATISL